MKFWKSLSLTAVLGSTLLLAACGSNAGSNNAESLTGSVNGDGSSTVAPIMEAVVEEYAAVQPEVKVTVGVSGTGGGFEKFIAGTTDFSNASREIKEEEAAKLKEAGIEYTEFQVAYDGLSIAINPENDWATDLTVEDLKKMWTEDGTAKKWSDINPAWPAEEIVFYSPGTDSGTFDFFNETILEEAPMVKSAIGFFGFAYYIENQDKLKAVKVNGVEPTTDTIESGEYSPLSRPLFVYAKNSALKDSAAFYDFMKFTLENAGDMAELVGYVRSPEKVYEDDLAKLENLK